MDPFAQMIRRKRRKNIWRMIVLSLVLMILVTAASFVFVFRINQFQVTMKLLGEEEVTVEYGWPYTDAGAEAVFSGDMLVKDGRAIPVVTEGKVDTRTVGTYTIRYSAALRNWKDSRVRTVHVVDSKEPRIMLNERPGNYVIPGEDYVEEGYSAWDNYDGDITDRVRRTESHGQVTYFVEDSSGNSTEITRQIVFYDPIPPEITLQGDPEIELTVGQKFTDPGCTATDNCDGDLTAQIQVEGSVNTNRSGTYTLTYSVSDKFGNTATVTRTVKIKPKPQPSTVDPGDKVVYLTFDDGPGKYTRELLDVLKQYNVKATFFVVNTGYTGLLDDIVSEGHSIGIHSVSHTYREIYASEDAFFDDLYKMQSIIEDKTGVKTMLMRFPGGSSNTVSSFNPGIMTRLTQAVVDDGFRYFDWNVNSGDAGGTTDTDQVYQNVIAGIQKHNVSVVLQHDIKGYSVDAVEKIIIWGLENGYTFLPLSMNSPGAHHDVNN